MSVCEVTTLSVGDPTATVVYIATPPVGQPAEPATMLTDQSHQNVTDSESSQLDFDRDVFSFNDVRFVFLQISSF
jgi:hypothetical protein